MKLCAVIPARDEEATVAEVVRGALEHCEEVVVVDDASRDGTARAAEEAGAVVVRRSGSGGKGSALRAGFEHAMGNGFDAVLTLDADGQHDTDAIPRFVRCAEQHNRDLVVGCRMANAGTMPRWKQFINWLTSKTVSHTIGYEVRDSQCGMRLISTDLLRRLPLRAEKYDIETEVLIEANALGVQPVEIPIPCIYRGGGRTHGWPDVVRFLLLCGRRQSRWTTALSLARFAAAASWPFIKTLLKIASLPLLVLLTLLFFTSVGGGSLPISREAVQSALAGVGILAPLLFIAICTLKPLIFIPVSGLTIIAGAGFGLWKGTLLVAIGGLGSAVVGFFVARVYLRSAVARYMEKRFPKADEWMAREGWTAILYARLMNIPWDWVSYAAGLFNIGFGKFMLATSIAVLPIAFTGTWLGSSLWSFPSVEFFAAFSLIFAFGTVTFLVRRHARLSRAA